MNYFGRRDQVCNLSKIVLVCFCWNWKTYLCQIWCKSVWKTAEISRQRKK